jgi:hypothetical protein
MPGQMNFTGYKTHFRMPHEESNGTGNFWYAIERIHMAELISTDIR